MGSLGAIVKDVSISRYQPDSCGFEITLFFGRSIINLRDWRYSKSAGFLLSSRKSLRFLTPSLFCFFKLQVKEGGSSSANGVSPGERLLTINGADVTQLPFADVVQQMVRAQGMVEMSFGPREGGVGASKAAVLKAATQAAAFLASAALPWAESPPALAKDASRGHVGTAGGALAGNRGFDPLGLGRDRQRLLALREAEVSPLCL
jgi:hypothetical protein